MVILSSKKVMEFPIIPPTFAIVMKGLKIIFFGFIALMSVSCRQAEGTDDYDAVENLIIGERMYRAAGNSLHRDCFWDDATIRTSWQSGGVGTFVGQTSIETRRDLIMVNRSPAPLIHINGDRAFVEFPSTTIRGVKIGQEDAILHSYMRLLYKVEKREGEWRILELVSLNEGDELAPAIPGTDLHIDVDLAKSLRPSYRWLAYSRIAAGGQESDDLPGTDRPEDVGRLYTEFNNWLNNITVKDIEIRNEVSGLMLRGTLYVPAGDSRKPLIICSHELGSDGMRPWWVAYANHWVNEGYAVLCYDFSGGGQMSRSEGATTDMSVLTEVSDLEQVLSVARGWDFVDTNRIILAGGSQGGGVSTIVAGKQGRNIRAMILLYPALHLPTDLHQRYPDRNNLPETDDRGMITIGRKYIEDMYDHNYDDDMKAYNGPVLIVHGNKDVVVPIEGSERALGVFPDASLHVIDGAGHVFMTPAQQEEFLLEADKFLKEL